MNTVSLDCLDKKLAGHPNYNKVELERLLTEIISKTSRPDQHRRIETVGHSDSTNKVKSTRIKAKHEKQHSRVDIKIQLLGLHEIWTIGVYLSKEDQKVIKTLSGSCKKRLLWLLKMKRKSKPK